MIEFLEPFILTFIPIFVAVDAIGNIPLFMSLVEGTTKRERDKIIIISVTVATVIAISFMFIGKWVLRFVGITISDFQIAGGCLLFIIAARLLLPESQRPFSSSSQDRDVGVFPLGTPLITGPAVLTTTLMMLDSFGIWPTLVSLILNMLIVWMALVKADLIMRSMGSGGIRALAKITYILLAAIAVMMVRRGIIGGFIR